MSLFTIRRRMALFPLMALLLLLSLTAPAGASPVAPTASELASLLDPLIARQLSKNDIPGAVVVVVKDGEILYKQGYGFANLEQQVPFDPDRTLFTIGSVTKLFTATAVMQQVEAGNLDLHTDVNRYLTTLQVPATYAEPITAAHLLTHTAGFDDQVIGWIATSPDEVEPLRENLTKYLPPRIRPPGQVSQYNNHGISLAGYLVEEATGLPFPEYLASHIWEPLGMTHTTFRPSTAIAPEIATGYMSLTGKTQPGQRVYFNIQPAGGIWTTATDMAAFMLAHLQDGTYLGRRILAPATVAEMHHQHFTAHPQVSGHAYGFFEHRVGNRRGLHHGGEDPEGFTSQLYLLPDEGVGLFVSYNKLGTQMATAELVTAFLDHYYPVPSIGDAPAGVAESVQRFAGSYKWVRQDRHSFTKALIAATTYGMQVRAEADGVLVTSTSGLAPFMQETRWVQVEPLLFQEAGGTATLAFDQDERGRITSLYLGWPQPLTMQRLSWYETLPFHLGVLLFMLLAFAPVVGWPVANLYRRLRRRQKPMSPALRLSRLVGGTVGGLTLFFLVGMPITILATFTGTYLVSPAIKVMLWLPVFSALLPIPLIVLAVHLWRRGEGSKLVRFQYSVMALAALVWVPFLYYWRLLGFHY